MAKFNLTEEALNRCLETVLNTPRQQTGVTYAVTARQRGVMCGVADVVDLLTDHCGASVVLRGKSDGEPFQPGEVVLTLTGPYGELVALETLYLGILSLSAGAANMSALTAAAGSAIRVIDTSARCYPPELIAPIALAAAIGGARGTTTQAGQNAVLERFGVGGDQICIGSRTPVMFRLHDHVPRSFRALYNEDALESAVAYHAAASGVALTLMIDPPERDACAEAIRRFGSGLEMVWLDTPPDRIHQGGHESATRTLEMRIVSQSPDRRAAQAALEQYGFGPGVTIEAVYAIRDLLDSMGARSTQIMASGAFTPEKIEAFRACQAPLDAIATDSWVEFGRFTSDIVAVAEGEQWIHRGLYAETAPELERLPVVFQK